MPYLSTIRSYVEPAIFRTLAAVPAASYPLSVQTPRLCMGVLLFRTTVVCDNGAPRKLRNKRKYNTATALHKSVDT